MRLKSSSIKSSETSAKYSWPRREQKDEIHDSGAADSEEDIAELVEVAERRDVDVRDAIVRSSRPLISEDSPLVDSFVVG